MESLQPYLTRKSEAINQLRTEWETARKNNSPDVGMITVTASSMLAGATGARPTRVGEHFIVSDSKQGLAGHSLGPTAPEMLLGALASCLVHTYVIQALLLEVPIGGIQVDVSARLDMAATVGMGGPPPRMEDITYCAIVESPSSQEAIGWLHAAVEANCPVLNTLKMPGDVRRVEET